MEEALAEMESTHTNRDLAQVEESEPAVQQADGPREMSSPQRMSGNHFSLA